MKDEKELDKDLTMLQGGPEDNSGSNILDQEWEKLMSRTSAPKTPAASPFETQSDVDNYIKGLQDDSEVLTSLRTGTRDSELDAGRSILESQNETRARNQNTAIKGIKAIGGGLLQGGLVALEQIGYVGDIDTYTNMFSDVDDYSGNNWSNMMSEAQEAVGESEMFKIYEGEEDPNSISAQIFKWSSLQAAVSSAVGFGISGLGASKLVSALGTTKKFKQLGQFVDVTLGELKGGAQMAKLTKDAYKAADAGEDLAGMAMGMKGAAKAFAGPLATSSMSNYFMGQMMATDTFKASMDSLESLIGTKKPDGSVFTRAEAQKLANNEAGDVVSLNMALALTGYIKFGGIFKRQNRFKSKVANPTLGWQAKQLVKTGSPTAFVENVYQEMIQMEQIHDTQAAAGVDQEDMEYSDNYWDRMTQLALSNRAVHAGALGVVGGPIQFAIIQRPMMGDQIKEQRNAYKKQQESLGWHERLVNNNFEIFRQFEKNSDDALKAGKLNEAVLNDDIAVINEIVKTNTWGTVESLIHDMEKISKMTPEEAASDANQFGEDYVEIANRVVETAKKVQAYSAELGNMVNKDGIVFTRVTRDRVAEEYLTTLMDSRKLGQKIKENVITQLGREVDLEVTDKGDITIRRNPNRFEGLTSSEELALRDKERAEQRAIDDILRYDVEHKDLKEKLRDVEKYKNFANKLSEEYEKLTSPEGQEAFIRKGKNAVSNLNDNMKKATRADKEDADAKTKNTGFRSYAEMLADKPPLTVEELRDLNEKYSEEVAQTPNERAVVKDETFSSRDDKGDVRVYTPGDVLRTTDGRTLIVDSQNESKSSYGETKVTMPIIYEATQTKKGDYVRKKGSLKTVLRDNSLIRPEVLQSTFSKGRYVYRGGKWAPYVNVDYILRPNHFHTQSTRADFAANGKLRSVNISGRMMNMPNMSWVEAYSMHLLNEPFTGPYDVVYKEKKVGASEVYIDVYKRVPGGEDILLTRLDKDYNLAHGDLLRLIRANNGEVTGQVIEHYSSRYNLNKKVDENGRVLRSPASTLKSLPEHFKLNGELVFASKRGKRFAGSEVARGTDGVVHRSTIDVAMPNGAFKTFNIPYDSIRAGDTAVLILSTNGEHLIPIPLGSTQIANQVSRQDGMSLADSYAEDHQQAIQDFLDAHNIDEAAVDKEIADSLEENKIPESMYEIEFSKAKRDWVYAQDKANKEHSFYSMLEKGVYQNVRPRFTKNQLEGTVNGKEIIAKTANGTPILNQNYFSMEIGVGEDGKFTPMIRVRKGEFQTLTDKDPGYVKPNKTKWEYIKYSDDSRRYLEVLGQQYKRAPISVLENANETSGQAARDEMANFINNEGLDTDLNAANPITGSSATLTVNGEAFAESSGAASKLHSDKLSKKFKKYVKDATDLKTVSKKRAAKLMQAFHEVMEDAINGDEFLNNLTAADDVTQIRDYVSSFVSQRLGIADNYKAEAIIDAMIEGIPEGRASEFNSMVESLKGRGITQFTDYIAQTVMALNDIAVKVSSGELTLKETNAFVKANDPTGKFTQPENFEFASGALVYHDTHGEVKFKYAIKAGNKAGMYKVQRLKDNKMFEVYPRDTYRHGHELMSISKINKAMAKLKPDSAKYKALAVTLAKLQTTFNKKKAYWNGETTSDGAAVDTGSGKSLIEAFEKTAASSAIQSAISAVASTKRASDLADYMEELIALDNARTEADNVGIPISAEIAKRAQDIYKKLPYSDADLVNLLSLAEGLALKGINTDVNKKHASYIEAAIKFREAVFNRTDTKKSVIVPYKYWGAVSGKYRNSKVTITGEEMADVNKPMTVEMGAASMFSVTKLMHNLITAETELRADLFAEVSSPATPNPASKKSGKEMSEELQSNMDIIKPFNKNKAVTWEDEYDSYYNTETDTQLRRATSLLKDSPTPSDLLTSASTIGTKIDNLWRDFFDGVKVGFDPKYGINNKEDFDSYVEDLKEFQSSLKAKGETVVSKDIVLYDDANRIAGTVDLLTYNNEGKFKIYDMKTMRKDKFTELGENGKPLYTTPFKKGGLSDLEYWQKQMSLYRIMLFNTHGILADSDVTVLATKVTYNPKDIASSQTEFLKALEIQAVDAVTTKDGEVIRMDSDKGTKAKEPAAPKPKGNFTNASTFTTVDAPFIPDTDHLLSVGFSQKFQTVEGAFYAHKLNYGEPGRYIQDGKYTDEALGIIDQLTKVKGEDAAAVGETIEIVEDGRWGAAQKHEVLATLLKDAVEQNHPSAQEFKDADFTKVVGKNIDGVSYSSALATAQEYVTVDTKPKDVAPVEPKPKAAPDPAVPPADVEVEMIAPETVFEGVALEKYNEHALPELMPQDIVFELSEVYREPDLDHYFSEIATAYAMGDSLDSIYAEIRNLPPFKKGKATNTQEAFDREVAAIKRMLPNVPVEILEDTNAMVKRYGVEAIGSFDRGVRFLVNNAVEGTGYHETFHAVAGLYLTTEQKQQIAEENGQEKWDLALEEKLAEQFEDYARSYKKPTFTQAVMKFFKNLISWFKNVQSPKYTERVFEKIVTRGYAKSPYKGWSTKLSAFTSVDGFQKEISDKNNVLLQRLMKSGRIKIVC